jgi:hypothetical protein
MVPSSDRRTPAIEWQLVLASAADSDDTITSQLAFYVSVNDVGGVQRCRLGLT